MNPVSEKPGTVQTTICFSVIIAAVRALTAVRRATLRWPLISTGPVRGLRDGRRLARQDRPRSGLGIHGVGLPGESTCAPVVPVHFEHLMPDSPDRASESRSVAAGALDAERGDAAVTLGPSDQLLVAVCGGGTRSIVEADSPRVDCHCHVDVRVGVHADDHLPRVRLDKSCDSSPGGLLGCWCVGRMGGQDCDGSTLQQAPIVSRPIRSDGLPGQSPTDNDRQISSQDRRSVKLRGRPPPAGTHQCHRATSAGSGMMLTVKLTKTSAVIPKQLGTS